MLGLIFVAVRIGRGTLCLRFCQYVLICLDVRGPTLVLDRVDPIDDAVCLRHSLGVEVLPDGQRKLLLLDSPLVLLPCHCGRKAADALVEDDVAEGVLERGGSVEVVGTAVALEDGSVLRVPTDLQRRCVSWCCGCGLVHCGGCRRGGGHSLLRCARSGRCWSRHCPRWTT